MKHSQSQTYNFSYKAAEIIQINLRKQFVTKCKETEAKRTQTNSIKANYLNEPNRGVWQLMEDEGSYLTKGNMLCLWNYKRIETVHVG